MPRRYSDKYFSLCPHRRRPACGLAGSPVFFACAVDLNDLPRLPEKRSVSCCRVFRSGSSVPISFFLSLLFLCLLFRDITLSSHAPVIPGIQGFSFASSPHILRTSQVCGRQTRQPLPGLRSQERNVSSSQDPALNFPRFQLQAGRKTLSPLISHLYISGRMSTSLSLRFVCLMTRISFCPIKSENLSFQFSGKCAFFYRDKIVCPRKGSSSPVIFFSSGICRDTEHLDPFHTFFIHPLYSFLTVHRGCQLDSPDILHRLSDRSPAGLAKDMIISGAVTLL